MKKNSKKRLSFALSMIMIATSINLTTPFSYAQNDIQNHWAKETLTKWQQDGKLKGDEKGNLNPDKSITRAEFMTMVNKAMGYKKQGDKIKSYTDVKEKDWFYNEVMTALEEGYISGTGDNMVSPKNKITRQEVMVIINKISQAENKSNFDITKVNDNNKIASWAKQAATNMIANGYISGYMGSINPTKDMKRAEAVVLLDAYKENNRTLSFEGEYNLGNINKLTILTGNIKIKDTKIKDLIINEQAKGKIELEKVEITGKTTNKSQDAQIYIDGQKVEIKDGKIEQIQEKEMAKYKDGQYEGKASGYGGDIKVKVTIKDGKIDKIEVIEQKEDAIYWNAAKKVIDRIIEKQETNVDTSAGATISSKGIMFAVEDALKKAENKKEEVKPKENYKDGEYIGESGGFSGTVKVKVTIKEGKIEELEVIQHSDDEPYMQSAKNLISKIKEKQNADVDIISGATYSSQGIINATKDALEQAKGKTQRPGQSEHALKNLSGGSSGGGTNSEIKQEQDFRDLKDGVYEASARGHNAPDSIKVRVTVQGSKIVKIELIDNKDDKPYFDDTKAEKIAKQIIEKQSTKGVDTISGATNSSKGFINAVVEALKQAGYVTKINANFDGQNKSLNEVLITAKDIEVKNLTAKDDLIVTEQVGDGNLTLENLIIKGNLIIQGGGENSVHLKNVNVEKQIEIDKKQGQRVRLVLEGETKLQDKLVVKTSSIIQTKDEVKIPTIELSKALDEGRETQIQAKTDKLDIQTDKTKILVQKGSEIKHIELPSNIDNYDKNKKEYIKDNFKLTIEDNTKIESGSNENIKGEFEFLSKSEVEELDNGKVYPDGIYYGDAIGYRKFKPTPVKLTIKDGKIFNVERFSSETRKLKAIPYPDVIDDGDKYDRAFDEIVNKIKSEQKPLELSYKLKVLTDVTEKIMQEVDGKTPSIQAYNKAFDKIIGKHNFGKNNKQFTMSEFSNKDNVRSAIIDLVEIYVKDELGYDMEFLDTVAGATYSSKGTALAVKNALKRTKSDVDVVDMRIIHNYKDSYIENELLDLSGLQAELYKKTQSGKIQKVTIPYSEFKQNGLKVVFRDTTKEIPDKLKLNNESLGHSILNGLELSVLHPKSYGIKLLNNINIKSDLITYKVSKIQIREKSSSDKWIDLKFETYIGNTGNVFEYIKYIELDKADFNKLIGKSVEFQVIATTKDGKNEKIFPTTNSKELIWPNFLSYGHSIYISEKEFLDENGKEKIRLEEGRTLKLHLKEQKTLASEFKETPKSINITTKTMLTADDIKTAFTTDLSTIVKNIEFDDTIDVTTEKKIDINVKLIFTDDSQKAFKIRLIVENPSSEADKYIVRLNPVSTTTSNMLDIEATKKIVKNAFVGLPNTAEIELKDTNKNYFEIEKVVEIPVIVRFKDGSTKEVNVPVTVKNTLNKAEQYQIEDYTQVNIKMVPSPESAVGPSSESLLKIFKSNLEEVSNSDNLKDNLIYALSIYEKQNKYGQINIDITSQPDRTKLGKTSGKARFTFDDNSSVEFDIPVEIIPFKLQYVPTSVRYPNIEYLLGDQVDLTKMEIISAVLSEKQNGEWKPNKSKTLLIPYQDFKLFGIDVISKHHNSEFENNTVLTRDYIEYNEKSKRYIIGLQLYHKEPTPREEQENGEIYIDIKNIKLKKFADMYKEEYPNTETVSIVPSTTLYTGRPNALNSTANAGKFDLRNIKRQLKIAEKEYKYGDISIELLDDSSIDNTKMGEQQQGKVKLIFTDKSELELDVPVIVKPFPIVTFSAQIGKMQKKYDLNSPIDLNNLQVFAKISENIDVRTGTWSQRGTTLPISYSEFGAFGLKVVKRNTTQEIKNGTIITQDIVNNDNEITLDIYSQEPTIGETIYPSTNVVQIEGLTIK